MIRQHLLTLGLTLALPALSWGAGGVAGSPHDFSMESWQRRGGVCSPCHQAHHTDPAQIVPLWAHATSGATFVPYTSPSLDASVGLPGGASLACLSCHDGSIAVNQNLSGIMGTNGPIYIDSGAQIGPDLHTTHPISFTYDAALATADGGLEDPTTYKIGDPKSALTVSTAPVPGTWTGTSLTGLTIDEALLRDHKMQCSSCHDVHRIAGSSATSGILLKISGQDVDTRGSLICRTCHIK